MARSFNGTSDRIDWPNIANPCAAAFTVSIWVNADSLPANGIRLWCFQISPSGDYGSLRITWDGRAYFGGFGNTTTVGRTTIDTDIPTGAWVHLLATWDGTIYGTGIHIYKNGTELSYSGTTDADTLPAADGLWSIGGRVDDDNRNFPGDAAAPGAWTRVLTAAEIASLARGTGPAQIPTGLIFAPRLTGANPEVDPISEENGTLDGTSFVADPLPFAFDRPYADSTKITAATIDWDSLINTGAPGSDLWPITWADDGHQYAGWGDGSGFAPTEDSDYTSLGIARIEGTKDSYTGYNRLNGFNAEYDQAFTSKPYGLLSISGTLYMWDWANAGPTCKLWKSTNHGQSWTDTGVEYTQAGDGVTPGTFLNFGQDYAGARDGYVYMYWIYLSGGWQDPGDSIQSDGNIFLARVAIANIETKSSYEWFAGMSGDDPTWTSTIGNKVAVFHDPNGVGWMCSAGYLSGPGRYFLATEHTQTLKGMIGIFEAPEPWGPWTTVLYEGAWGEVPADAASFAWFFSPKWCSGSDFALVYSGSSEAEDAWNTVEGVFTLESPSISPGAAALALTGVAPVKGFGIVTPTTRKLGT